MIDRLTYTIGNRDSPTDPFGHEQLSVYRSGTFTYQQSRSNHSIYHTGQADLELVGALFIAMQNFTPPDSSKPVFLPGDRVVSLSLELQNNKKEILIDLSTGLLLKHVQEVIAWGESWTAWLRNSEGGPPTGIQ